MLTVADEIMKTRPFSLIHGGVLDTRDIIGIRKGNARKKIPLLRVFNKANFHLDFLYKLVKGIVS